MGNGKYLLAFLLVIVGVVLLFFFFKTDKRSLSLLFLSCFFYAAQFLSSLAFSCYTTIGNSGLIRGKFAGPVLNIGEKPLVKKEGWI
jgi:hypothetical protein